jgi:hypothetical protein
VTSDWIVACNVTPSGVDARRHDGMHCPVVEQCDHQQGPLVADPVEDLAYVAILARASHWNVSSVQPE